MCLPNVRYEMRYISRLTRLKCVMQKKLVEWSVKRMFNLTFSYSVAKMKGNSNLMSFFCFRFHFAHFSSSVKKSSDKISGHFRLLSNFAAKNKLNRIFKRCRVQIPFGRTLSSSNWINKNLPNGFHRVLSMWKNDNEKAKVCREHFYSCISINFPSDSVLSTHQRALRMMGN